MEKSENVGIKSAFTPIIFHSTTKTHPQLKVVWTHGGHWERHGEVVRRETKVVWMQFFFLPFSYSAQSLSYNAQPKVTVHCSYGAKKYSFGSPIARYILIFSSAKN